jgi:hypothetical protein
MPKKAVKTYSGYLEVLQIGMEIVPGEGAEYAFKGFFKILAYVLLYFSAEAMRLAP